jgi:nicotinate-nucleotide adenylyltransferase
MPQTVSSTQVREALRAGRPIDGLVPSAVAAYIAAHGLYTEQVRTLPTDEQIIDIIAKRETPYRFRHSLAVAEEAARLARKYGADEAKARTCGLLHDIFKDADGDAQLQILKEFDIIADEVTRAAPKLWHACAGAAFMEHILGFSDREMIDAVRYHTTARAGMCLLEKILYLADFTSADRNYPDVDVMRRLTDESIEAGMLYSLRYTIRELLEKGAPVHPDTLAAYNALLLCKGGTSDG